jgi:hypothetical protein
MKSNKNELVCEAIISTDEIKLILDRYRIGKKPLAKLLGWGETTIIRYMEGDIPTNEYSSKLRTILDDPEYYYDLLCKKREALTGVAFKKSKKAVLAKIMATNIYAVAYYIVNKSNADMCASYIQYLLYYSQAFSLAFYDKEIFQEDCGVNNENMPYLKIFDDMRRFGVHSLEGVEEYLSTEDIQLIDAVMESFLWYGPKALNAMMFYEKSFMSVTKDKYNNKIISKESLKSYFKDILEQYQMKSIQDIHSYPDQKISNIRDLE